ncbi:fibronectin type III domain-containing protein [Maribacter sp.]|uniref:fibronectin type III domain-containing protein n=1 Tax=Maribacter sp. TaxID=1897614 RepID=UPI00329840B0
MNKIVEILIALFFFLKNGFLVTPTKKSSERMKLALVKEKTSEHLPTNSQQPTTNNRQRTTIYLFLLFAFYSILTAAQNFPVQVVPQAIPPAPIYVSNYADASTINSPLRVQITLNDFEIANREIRIKTYFQGSALSFQSNDIVVGASPLFLEGGLPLILTNADLAPYFRFENITGINGNQYGNPIPEGAYQFCIEVYDVLTGNRLSNKSCALSVVFQNEPPFLVLPRNKTNVEETNPQNIVFQWTPRSINVTNVQYELSLVEIWDTQVDPQQAFLSSPPIFQTTTTATTYVYSPSDPLLLSGKNYAWRVQAKAQSGIEEIGLFKNQGYSEIFSFSHAESCNLPTAIGHEVKGSTNANIFWDDFSTEIPEYTVRYRQKNVADAEWFTNNTTSNETTLWDLKVGTTYQYQILKQCAVTGSEWSIIKEFTTFIADNEESVYDCNINPEFDISNSEPLTSINAGEQFTAGDFPINVLTASGSNGYFTGTGYVTIPYLNSIRVGVEFTNIFINTDKQLTEGTVTTLYDPTLSNILDIDEAIDTVENIVDSVGEFFEGDTDRDEITVNWAITKDDIKVEDGFVIITNPNTGATKTEPLGDDMAITDSAGNTFYVTEDGEITEGGQLDDHGSVSASSVTGVSNNGQIEALTAPGIKVTFNTKGTYGMDMIPTGSALGNIPQEYTVIKDATGADYPLTHHAVKLQDNTRIVGAISIQNSEYDAEDLIFKNKIGEIIPRTIEGNSVSISLPGRHTFENETIYALVESKVDSTKQLTAGAFTLWHLKERNIDVAIVSAGASMGDVETTVQNIFKQGLANINFKPRILLNVDDVASALGTNGMDIGDSPFTAAYNTEQKALKNLAKAAGANDPDTYYIIVLGDEFLNTKQIAGFMPLQRQYGFVFERYTGSGELTNKEEAKGTISKTLAHEIGHGVFALQHPFSEYGSSENATNWLMDYSNGDNLPHTHWAQIHNPDLKFYIFQDEEDGQSTLVSVIPNEFKNSDGTSYTFMTLNGSYITLPDTVKNLVFVTGLDEIEPYSKYPTGALIGFTLEDEIFKAKISGNNPTNEPYTVADFSFNYEGFESQNTNQPYNDITRQHYSNGVITFSPRSENRLLLRTQVPDLSFIENSLVNILQEADNEKYTRIFEGTVLASKTYLYQETSAYDAGYIVNEELVGHILGEGIDWNSHYPIISKIAILYNSYPNLIKEIFPLLPLKEVDTHGSSIEISKAHIPLKSIANDNGDLTFIYLGLLNAVHGNLNNCLETLNSLNLNSLPKQVENCIKNLSDDELKEISVENKIIALSLMLDNWILDDDQEIALIRLIKFTKENDVDDLLDKLNAVSQVADADYNLLRRLVYKTDNDHTYFHEDNYKELINVIADLCITKSAMFSNELSLFTLDDLFDRNINFYYRSFWNTTLAEQKLTWDFFTGQDLYSYDTKTTWTSPNENDAHITIYNEQYLGARKVSETENISLNPYSVIYFTNRASLSMLNEYNNNNPTLSPAILAYYADDVGGTQTVVDGIQATVDIVSMASGYGALAKAPSLIRKTFIISDMIGSGVSLTQQAVGVENLNPETKAFLDALNILTATVAVTDVGSSLINMKNIFGQVQNIEKGLPSKTEAESFLDAVIAAEGKLEGIKVTNKVKEAKVWLAQFEMEVALGNLDDLKIKLNRARNVITSLEDASSSITYVRNLLPETSSLAFEKLLEELPQGQRGAVFDKLISFEDDNAIISFFENVNGNHGALSASANKVYDKFADLDADILDVWYIIYKANGNKFPQKRFDFDFLNANIGATHIDDITNYSTTTARVLDAIDQNYNLVRALVNNRGNVRSNLFTFMDANPNAIYTRNYINALAEAGFPTKAANTNWATYYRTLDLTIFNPFDVHHILPVNMLELEPLQLYFQFYTGTNKINFNALGDARNAIPLERYSTGGGSLLNRGVHTNHADYEEALKAWISDRWNKILDEADEIGLTQQQQLENLHDQLETLTTGIQKGLLDQSVKNSTNVNDLFGVNSTDDIPLKINAVQDILNRYN